MATDLWALHIHGPDDVIACVDRKEADEKAAEINAAYERFKVRDGADAELDGRWHAEVITWPPPWDPSWTAAEHAEEVARGDERWEA